MRAAVLLLCSALATITACTSDTPAPQLPADGGAGDGALVGDDAAAAADAAPGQDAVPGQDAAPGQDATAPGPDGGAPVDSGIFDTCDPLAQNCPAMGDKCVIEPAMTGDGARCAPELATDPGLGEVCGGGDCQAGLVCVNTGTVARCGTVCDRVSGAPCSAMGADYDCTSVLTTNWGVCRQLPPACDPVTLAPCAADQACQPVRRASGAFEFRCRAPGIGTAGQRCENSGCVRGLMCVREEGVSLCRQACVDGGDPCPMGLACNGTVLMTQKYCR